MNKTSPTSDPILDELHAIREQLHDECHGDLARLVAEMRIRQNASGHPLATIPVPAHVEPQTTR